MTPWEFSIHRLRRASWTLLAGLTLLALAPAAARADEPDIGPVVFTVAVPHDKVSLKQAHDAVVRAALGREWNVQDDHEKKVVIHLLHRKNEATVTFLITDESIEAHCVGYAVDKAGNREKPEQPTGWLKYLERDITKALNQAAFLPGK